MKKLQFLAAANTDGIIKVDFNKPIGSTTFRTGDTHNTVFVGNDEVCVHNESWPQFSSEINDDGVLPADWKVSKSKMLYKSTPRKEGADFKSF